MTLIDVKGSLTKSQTREVEKALAGVLKEAGVSTVYSIRTINIDTTTRRYSVSLSANNADLEAVHGE